MRMKITIQIIIKIHFNNKMMKRFLKEEEKIIKKLIKKRIKEIHKMPIIKIK